MSVFSKLRRSKKAAHEHNATKAQKANEPEVKVPYKHVPTHAAHDALSSSPLAWKEHDRAKIQEHNKRMSQIAISRSESVLSTASNMNDRAVSIAGSAHSSSSRLPRNSSYNSFHAATFCDKDYEARRKNLRAHSQYGQMGTYKGTSYGRTYSSRGHISTDSGIGPSPLSSAVHSEETSPVVSSGNSTNSNSSENLEIEMTSLPSRTEKRSRSNAEHSRRTSRQTSNPQPPTAVTVPAAVVVKGPMPTAQLVAQEQKQKKQRWSLRRRNTTPSIPAAS